MKKLIYKAFLTLTLLTTPFTVKSIDNKKLLNPSEMITLNNVLDLVNKVKHLNEDYEELSIKCDSYLKDKEDMVKKLKAILDGNLSENHTHSINSSGEIK